MPSTPARRKYQSKIDALGPCRHDVAGDPRRCDRALEARARSASMAPAAGHPAACAASCSALSRSTATRAAAAAASRVDARSIVWQRVAQAWTLVVETPEQQEREIQRRGPDGRAEGDDPGGAPDARRPAKVARREHDPGDGDPADEQIEERERRQVRQRGQQRLNDRVETGRVPALHDAGRWGDQRGASSRRHEHAAAPIRGSRPHLDDCALTDAARLIAKFPVFSKLGETRHGAARASSS